MKLISWNVNGLRACVTKGFKERFQELDADIFCIQESKLQEGQIELELRDIISTGIMREKGIFRYGDFYKAGAAVCAIWNQHQRNMNQEGQGDHTGTPGFFHGDRIHTKFSERLARLPYRNAMGRCFLAYLKGLEKEKPVIFAVDLNVAHCEPRLKEPENQSEKCRIHR